MHSWLFRNMNQNGESVVYAFVGLAVWQSGPSERRKDYEAVAVCAVVWLVCDALAWGAQTYSVKGRVFSRATGEGVPFVSVGIWNTSRGTTTDSVGNYRIGNLPPGMYRVQVSSVGYKTYVSPEFHITTYDYTLDIGLDESQVALGEVSVVAAPFRRSVESPIAMRVIGVQEIEKSPGANRDISKVVNRFPPAWLTVAAGAIATT